MNRSQLYTIAADRAGISKNEAQRALDAAFEAMAAALERGEKVQLSGFGMFETRQRKEKVGRDPRTGEPIPIPATEVAVFKPGKKLRQRIEK
jgi:DNA-binding protein HU-beta